MLKENWRYNKTMKKRVWSFILDLFTIIDAVDDAQ